MKRLGSATLSACSAPTACGSAGDGDAVNSCTCISRSRNSSQAVHTHSNTIRTLFAHYMYSHTIHTVVAYRIHSQSGIRTPTLPAHRFGN